MNSTRKAPKLVTKNVELNLDSKVYNNSSFINENVNRIIQNDLKNVQDYETSDLANNYSKFYNEISKLKLKSNENKLQTDDDDDDEDEDDEKNDEDKDDIIDIISNSIENDDFYFAYSTTESSPSSPETEIDDVEADNKNDSDHMDASAILKTTTPIHFSESSPATTSSSTTLNQTIPYNIPFQFNNSHVVDIYKITELLATNKTKSLEISSEIEEPSTLSKAAEPVETNNDNSNSENTMISIDLVVDNLNTIITPSPTTTTVTLLSTTTTTAMSTETIEIIITEIIKPEIETSENEISSTTTSTIDVINILTTTSLPVDLNTTKSIPYPGFELNLRSRILFFEFFCL